MKYNKKGFTMIELITVLFLLSIVALLFISNFSGLLSNVDKEKEGSENAILEDALSVYYHLSMNNGTLEYDKKGDTIISCIRIGTLISNGYIEENIKYNPAMFAVINVTNGEMTYDLTTDASKCDVGRTVLSGVYNEDISSSIGSGGNAGDYSFKQSITMTDVNTFNVNTNFEFMSLFLDIQVAYKDTYIMMILDNSSSMASGGSTTISCPSGSQGNSGSPTIISTSLQNGSSNTAYCFSVKYSGKPPQGSINVTATGLPPGLSMASNGAISGIPTTEGTYSVTVKLTQSNNGNVLVTKTFPLTIEKGIAKPVVNLTPIAAALEAVKGLSETLVAESTPQFTFCSGLIAFGIDAVKKSDFTSHVFTSTAMNIQANSAGTNYQAALKMAYQLIYTTPLNYIETECNMNKTPKKDYSVVVIFLSDGEPNRPDSNESSYINYANDIKNKGATIYTIGFNYKGGTRLPNIASKACGENKNEPCYFEEDTEGIIERLKKIANATIDASKEAEFKTGKIDFEINEDYFSFDKKYPVSDKISYKNGIVTIELDMNDFDPNTGKFNGIFDFNVLFRDDIIFPENTIEVNMFESVTITFRDKDGKESDNPIKFEKKDLPKLTLSQKQVSVAN